MPRDPRQDAEAVREWMEQSLPGLKEQAEKEDKSLFCADELFFMLYQNDLGIKWLKNADLKINFWDKQFQTYGVCGSINEEVRFFHTHQQGNFKVKHMVGEHQKCYLPRSK